MVDRPKLASTIVDDDAPADAAVARADTASLRRGAALGRYVVLDELGAGGMGVVYAAYDPELDRKLAVKLLRDDLGGAVDRRARLLREAQALARLDHPNVVAVYDVGTIGDHVFIAMEFVAGQTVTAWLAERPRDWRAIIGVYVLAGRGLAAAHALGIVHRDFKPDNVLIDGDGRVRVVDFGLARTSEDAADAPSRSTSAPDWERQTDGSGRAALAQTITRTGTLMGTPGYIAPEIQHGKTSHAVDQFSFCVALWRALYGELPFAGESAAELAAAAAEGKLRAPARQTRVPARIHRVLVRGLSANPEDRFASMDKLLDALAHHSARRRYVIATCVTVPIVLASVIGLGAMRSDDSQICRGAERQLAGVWDPDHRAAISRAFAATKMPFATTSAAGVTGLLDQYAGAWSTMRTEACEATRVRGEQSEELLDLRMACLDARARELRAFADVLAHADAKTVEKSFQAAQALSPLSDCADSAGLKAPVRLPANPAIRAQIAELRGNLAEARALDIAGKFKDAIARAQPLVVAARATHYRPLEATALTVLGTAQRNANDYPAAQQTLEAAVAAAIAARDDATAADAATSLVRVVAYDRAKPEDGEPWIARAQAFLEAHDDERVRAQLDNNVGIVRFAADRFDEALAQYQTSLALRERLYGAQSPLVAASLDNIGLVYDSKGEYARGTDFHKRALAIDLEALGPMHPSTALTLTNLAVSLHNQGLFDEALTTAQRAVMIKEAAYGPESAPVAMSLNEIGNIYFFQARYSEAAEIFRRTLAIKRKTLGPEHPSVAAALGNLANCLEREHKVDEALPYATEAFAIAIKALGPDHSDMGHRYTLLGQLALDRKQYDEALAQFQHAATVWEKTVGADHPLVAASYNGVADTYLAAGNPAKAIEAYNRALKIRESKPVDVADHASTLLGLAKASWATGQHAKARAFGERSVKLYTEAGSRSDEARHDAETWMTSHVDTGDVHR